jgi:hypothetical protein
MSKTTKILLVLLSAVLLIGIFTIILINKSEKPDLKSTGITSAMINKNEEADQNDLIAKLTSNKQEQYEEILKNKDFIKAYNNFQYINSELIDAGLIEDNGILFYMVFDSQDDFEKIDYFYKNKKVQSVWSRTEIFETFNKKLEESFKNDNEKISGLELKDLKFSKYSFTSQDKDRYLNILIKSLPEGSTRIMLVSWDLDL